MNQPDLFPRPAAPARQSHAAPNPIRDEAGRIIGASPHPIGSADYEADVKVIRAFDIAVAEIVAESAAKKAAKGKGKLCRSA